MSNIMLVLVIVLVSIGLILFPGLFFILCSTLPGEESPGSEEPDKEGDHNNDDKRQVKPEEQEFYSHCINVLYDEQQ